MGFGASKPTLEEQLKESKREINKSIRELDRERNKLEAEEKRLINDIKVAAQKGETSSTRIIARDLVRVRKHMRKFYELRSQLQAVSLRLQTVKSTQAMTDSMRSVAKIMVNMNEQMDMTALHKVVMNFMKESEKLGVTEDMMNDTVEDAMGDIEDEEEEESVIHKVLDEIGVELSGQLLTAPVGILPTGPQSRPINHQNQRQPPTMEPVRVSADCQQTPNCADRPIISQRTDKDNHSQKEALPSKNLEQLETSIQKRLKNLKS